MTSKYCEALRSCPAIFETVNVDTTKLLRKLRKQWIVGSISLYPGSKIQKFQSKKQLLRYFSTAPLRLVTQLHSKVVCFRIEGLALFHPLEFKLKWFFGILFLQKKRLNSPKVGWDSSIFHRHRHPPPQIRPWPWHCSRYRPWKRHPREFAEHPEGQDPPQFSSNLPHGFKWTRWWANFCGYFWGRGT